MCVLDVCACMNGGQRTTLGVVSFLRCTLPYISDRGLNSRVWDDKCAIMPGFFYVHSEDGTQVCRLMNTSTESSSRHLLETFICIRVLCTCVHVCLCTICMLGSHGGQKMASDLLGLEL